MGNASSTQKVICATLAASLILVDFHVVVMLLRIYVTMLRPIVLSAVLSGNLIDVLIS